MAQPTNMSTDQILDAMRMGVDYSFTLKCRSFSMAVRVLSVAESLRLAAEIEEELSTNKAGEFQEGVIRAIRTLTAASKKPDSPLEPPVSSLTFQRMTPDEVLYLLRQYQDGLARLNPALDDMPVEALTELVEHVKKNHSTLDGLSRSLLATIVRFLLTSGATQAAK